MGRPSRPLLDRLAAGIAVTEADCWEWQGATGSGGYGRIRVNKARSDYTHRVSYELHVGPIPEGLHIDHLCRNPPCCNPEHLEPVTTAENLRRGWAAKYPGREPGTCGLGHPLDGVYLRSGRSPRHYCKECHRNRTKAYTERARGGPYQGHSAREERR